MLPIIVKSGTITSSPGPMFSVASAKWMAVVPLVVVTACFTPRNAANSASNCSMYFPAELIQPDSMASATYCFASFVRTGSLTGTLRGEVMVWHGKSWLPYHRGTVLALLLSCGSVPTHRCRVLRGGTAKNLRLPTLALQEHSIPHQTPLLLSSLSLHREIH